MEGRSAPSLGYLLELRLRLRGNSEGLAIVDRALAIIARAECATPDVHRGLLAEVHRLGEELALRFGSPSKAKTH